MKQTSKTTKQNNNIKPFCMMFGFFLKLNTIRKLFLIGLIKPKQNN